MATIMNRTPSGSLGKERPQVFTITSARMFRDNPDKVSAISFELTQGTGIVVTLLRDELDELLAYRERIEAGHRADAETRARNDAIRSQKGTRNAEV